MVRVGRAGMVMIILGVTIAAALVAVRAERDPSVASADVGSQVSPKCPSHDRHPIVSASAGAATTLVPSGAQKLLLCRYSGVGQPLNGSRSLALIAQHQLSTKATGALASQLNALPAPTGTFHCPADIGTAIVAFFRYSPPAAADDPVTIRLSGCSTVTNGQLMRIASTTAAGRRLLDALRFQTRAAAYEVRAYRLLTHCGIRWARIRGTFWKTNRPLSDGRGNPPAGWGNPYQAGTLTFTSERTAVFSSPAGTVAFHRTSRTRVPLICS
jgi:hypothetical protein